ncbi:MAG: arylsulfotransferase family protein [Parvularculaceae bacterium]|nr:aryl-sulfate sulfotransferase [Parvularculaceae bacterium]
MKLDETTAKKVFVASAGAAIFVSGALIGALAPPVNGALVRAAKEIGDIRRNFLAYAGLRPIGHLEPFRREIFNAVQVNKAFAQPGVTLVTGLFGDRLAARLYDIDGEVIHEWPNNFFDIFERGKKYKFDALLHGDHLYPNGDLLVSIDGRGLARVNACGDVIWKSMVRSHHSIDIDDDGYIWTPHSPKLYDDKRLAEEPVRIDRLIKIDPDTGEIVEKIELAEILLRDRTESIIKGNRVRPSDVFHLNDVEILKKHMAEAFPMFSPGDIMLSSRNINLTIVLDGKTRDIKWRRIGPAHGQHDPDFQPNGEISIFDNRIAGEAERGNNFLGNAGGSRIIAIRPDRFGYRTIYESDERNAFYSAYRGKHQMLENGNVLITESEGGRIFEATANGDIAWMLVNKYDENTVGWLMSATRYPVSYASIGAACAER